MKLLYWIIFLMFSFCVVQAQSTDPKICIEDMQKAYNNNDMTSVITHSLQYIRLRPESTTGYTYYGYANSKKGLYWNAIEAYTKILGLTSIGNSAQLNRAGMYQKVGYDSLSIADIEEVIKKYPRYARAYNMRGGYHMIMGEKDNFFSDVHKSLHLEPNTVSAYMNIVEVYHGTMQFDSAYIYLNKVIELDPDYARAYSKRAWIKYYKGKPFNEIKSDCLKAIALYEQQLKNNTYDLSIHSSLANIYVLLNNKDKAKSIVENIIEPLNEYIRLYPDSYLTYYSRGVAYTILERDSEGMSDFKKAMEMNPKCPLMQWTLNLDEYEKTLKSQ